MTVLVGVFVGDKVILGVTLDVGVGVGTGQTLSSQSPNKVNVANPGVIIFLTHVVTLFPGEIVWNVPSHFNIIAKSGRKGEYVIE